MAPSRSRIEAYLIGLQRRDIDERARRVRDRARELLAGADGHPRRVRTGELLASVMTAPTTYGGLPAARIGTRLRRGRWVHDGTGIYGPRRHRIEPVRARVLVFRGRGGLVFVRWVRGMRPNHFLTDALRAARK